MEKALTIENQLWNVIELAKACEGEHTIRRAINQIKEIVQPSYEYKVLPSQGVLPPRLRVSYTPPFGETFNVEVGFEYYPDIVKILLEDCALKLAEMTFCKELISALEVQDVYEALLYEAKRLTP